MAKSNEGVYLYLDAYATVTIILCHIIALEPSILPIKLIKGFIYFMIGTQSSYIIKMYIKLEFQL